MLSSSSIRALISFAGNPDYLSPVVQKNAKNGTLLYHEPAIGKWVGPFFMEATNMRYVRRTNHLLKYGDQFQYGEGVVHKSFFLAAIAAVVQYLAIFLILFPPIRWVIARIIPPGTGPSEKQRKEGYFNLKLVGESEPVHIN